MTELLNTHRYLATFGEALTVQVTLMYWPSPVAYTLEGLESSEHTGESGGGGRGVRILLPASGVECLVGGGCVWVCVGGVRRSVCGEA